ncbi:hypothetical protein HNV11_21130 [Spirosoma taeanense]|uniref:Uncharacterized protein n=1 Tax=Spirosoma taeanense TaxID=2735870 RepID=A0A6M5YCD1_9BACT|nr:hypothetical protein [Spirosoma taeanense]QJW91705.1 hypothetical protein HNV11_21130 [Spirosoma taeanense]
MTTPISSQRQSQLHQLIGSPIFDRNRPDDGACEQTFAELIRLVDDLLHQSEKAGHRVDFTNGVGVHGKIQDITSLVESIRRSVIPQTGLPAHFAPGQFNCYYDAGNGYFANGVFFSADYDADVAFFVDEQRIYLRHHIERAVQEAEQHLLKPTTPTTRL